MASDHLQGRQIESFDLGGCDSYKFVHNSQLFCGSKSGRNDSQTVRVGVPGPTTWVSMKCLKRTQPNPSAPLLRKESACTILNSRWEFQPECAFLEWTNNLSAIPVHPLAEHISIRGSLRRR